MRHDFRQAAGFQQDLLDLPMSVRKAAAQVLVDIVEGRLRGQLLEVHSATADLSDCRKVYFDPNPQSRPRYRLVYLEASGKVTGISVVAVSVGQRAGLDAYTRAPKNLGR